MGQSRPGPEATRASRAGRRSVTRAAVALVLVAALGFAAAAPAEDVNALLSAARPAVVRLVYPGGAPTSGCSGVLTDAGTVLTAGHCLGPDGTGRPDILVDTGTHDTGTHDTGTHDADSAAPRRLRTVSGALHPSATGGPGPGDLGRLHPDLSPSAPPLPGLPFGPPPVVGETLLLLGYRNDMAGARTEAFCPVLNVDDVALLACPVQNGLSGAPLLRAGLAGPEIAAIIVARLGPTAIAALPDTWTRGD